MIQLLFSKPYVERHSLRLGSLYISNFVIIWRANAVTAPVPLQGDSDYSFM